MKGEITSRSEKELFTYKEATLLQAIDNPIENKELAESIHKMILPSINSHICQLGYFSLLKQLSDMTNLNSPEINDGKTPLHIAACQNNYEIINEEDKEGRTPLFYAIKSRNKVAAKELVSAKAIIKAPRAEITRLLLKSL